MEVVFHSQNHPQEALRTALFGTAVVRPLGITMIPIMIGALVAMLGSRSPLDWLYFGFPIAVAVSSAWTVLQLRRQTVEVRIRDESVRALSAWDAAVPVAAVRGLSLVDLRYESGRLSLTLGHDTRVLFLNEWPDPTALREALQGAKSAFSNRVQDLLES